MTLSDLVPQIAFAQFKKTKRFSLFRLVERPDRKAKTSRKKKCMKIEVFLSVMHDGLKRGTQ